MTSTAAPAPVSLPPSQAAEVLKGALAGHEGNLTIADAAAKSGLALRDAEAGLHHLVSTYRGTLSATSEGELLFKFPYGFSLPLTKRPAVLRFFDKAKRTLLGVGKFVVRAWISVVLIGYVGVFALLLIGLLLARSDRDSRGGDGFGLLYVLLRVVSEAVFWTFHPFSPFATTTWEARGTRRVQKAAKEPFYARVNRFVFGPEEPPKDPREMERRLLATIRVNKGRIGISDVMRVTGLEREEADPLMARLMLDYEGSVEVSDDGGIWYRFPELRKSAGEAGPERAPPPVWFQKLTAAPLTGNDTGSNLLIAGLNAFNLVMSLVAMKAGWTIERLIAIFENMQQRFPLPLPPPEGIPWALGVVPFLFSTLLFALPVYRWATDDSRKKKVEAENARRAVLKTVLERGATGPVDEARLKSAWKEATGKEPDDKELLREVVKLGGDVDMDTGRAAYRFRDLEAEVKALEEERKRASEQEAQVGHVVFSSDA